MAFIRVEPVHGPGPDRLVQRSSARDHVGRRATPDHPARGRPRGGLGLSRSISGPRTLFEVDTPRARLSLTFQHRSRRWTVTGLDEGVRRAA